MRKIRKLRKKFIIPFLFLASNVFAFRGQTYETGLLPNIAEFSTFTYVTLGADGKANNYSTYTVSGVWDWWEFETKGATASFRIEYSTVQPWAVDASTFVIHRSSAINMQANQIKSDDVRWFIENARIVVLDLGENGTAYIRIGYARAESDAR